jgi:hypothetical protein
VKEYASIRELISALQPSVSPSPLVAESHGAQ